MLGKIRGLLNKITNSHEFYANGRPFDDNETIFENGVCYQSFELKYSQKFEESY